MSRSPRPVELCWLGSVPYRDAWDRQRELVEEVRAGHRPDTVLLLEHPHVFTMGRRAVIEHVLWDEAERERRGVDLVWCDRGGDVTYHGPGQLVGYPILDLRHHGGDVLLYLRRLEQTLIDYLRLLDVGAWRVPDYTGVWTAQGKIAAIGVKLTESVVSHGFALNLQTDLEYFGGIVPCGIEDKEVTSVAAVAGRAPEPERAARAWAQVFADAFAAAPALGKGREISVI
jgi:lipoyl(octanoyl) transferase